MSLTSLFGFLKKNTNNKKVVSSNKASKQKPRKRRQAKKPIKPFNTPDITTINIDNQQIVDDNLCKVFQQLFSHHHNKV